ncbi:MAG: tetratricopeptide repeat protein [Proteobacteria bacterium]|nr:tetratricopeptide repeat protein [Pseudomonadota bacterium]
MRTLALALALLLPVAACASPPTAVPDVLRAYLAERSGQSEEALDALLQAIEADPESAALRLESARLLLSQRRFDEALEIVNRGVELRPGQADLLLLKARLLEVLDRGDEAVGVAREAVGSGGGAEAHALVVRLLEGLDRREEALQEAQAWATAEPGNADAHFAVGRLLVLQGDRDSARQAFGKALGLDPNHRATLRAMGTAVCKLDPPPDLVLVDGLQKPDLLLPAEAVVNGDALSAAIAAASILAKVFRDRIMTAWDRRFPGYGFAAHKGYGAAAHLAALRERGACPLHRFSYKPIAELDQGRLF